MLLAPKGGAAANIGLMTYNGTGYVGLNIDTRAIPDPDVFIEHIRAGFDDVLAGAPLFDGAAGPDCGVTRILAGNDGAQIFEGVTVSGAHTAAGDCLMTLELLTIMAAEAGEEG